MLRRRSCAGGSRGRPGRWSTVRGAEHQLGLIRAEAARRGTAVHIVTGLIHVLDIWKAAWCQHPAGDPRGLAHRDRVIDEGACRHLIGDRVDITGARWGSKAPKPSSPCGP